MSAATPARDSDSFAAPTSTAVTAFSMNGPTTGMNEIAVFAASSTTGGRRSPGGGCLAPISLVSAASV